jgi:cytochrome c-type biogenesis protein
MEQKSAIGLKKLQSLKFTVIILLLLASIIIFTVSVTAQSELPAGLQKIIDYNKKATESFALKITFFIAFTAGILGILSPCILPFLPAYFSYTFKEKKNITLMTLVFFFGFSISFVTMGVIAGFLGSQLMSIVQTGLLVTIAGIFIIIFGIMSLLGKGFSSFIKPRINVKNDVLGVFLLGIFFAIGWSACLGPVLAGILGMGAILGSAAKSGVLLFFYSLGNFLPLFILSIFYDKFNLADSKFIKGKTFEISIGNKAYDIHSTNLISGVLFIILGSIMVIYQGTSVFNTWDFLRTKNYFYSVQDQLLNWGYANIFGIVIFLIFVIAIGLFLWKRRPSLR